MVAEQLWVFFEYFNPLRLIFVLRDLFPFFVEILVTLCRQLDFIPFYLFVFISWWVDVFREENPLLVLFSLPRTVMSFHHSDPAFADECIDIESDVDVASLELLIFRDTVASMLEKVVFEFSFVVDGIRLLEPKHALINFNVWIARRLLKLIDEIFHRQFFENGLAVFSIVHLNDGKSRVFEVLDALLSQLG